MGSSKPAVAVETSPAMTVLTQHIIINNNNNLIQSGARLKRSWSTGSGDKIQSKTLPDSSDITDGLVPHKLIEALPDLLSNLVINSNQTKLFEDNNLSEEKMMETL